MFTPNGSPDTYFFRATIQRMSWQRGVPYLLPSLVVSSFLFLASTLFSNWRRTVSFQFFDTQIPSVSIKELVFPRHDCCVLSRPYCHEHSLLFHSCLSRIGRIKNSLCSACGYPSQGPTHSFCTVHLRLFTPHALWRLPVFLRPLV